VGLPYAAAPKEQKADVDERVLVNEALGRKQSAPYRDANRLEVLE
jgi:hypothetical protein